MKLNVDIDFNQLVKLMKQLSPAEWSALKEEVEKEFGPHELQSVHELFLLNAPTFTKKQVKEINRTRKSIKNWRMK